MAEVNSETGASDYHPGIARSSSQRRSEAWEQLPEAGRQRTEPIGAQLVAGAFFSLAESSPAALEAERQRRRRRPGPADRRRSRSPSLGSLSTLAIYQYFAVDFAAGDKAAKQAAALANSQVRSERTSKNSWPKSANARKALQKQQKEVAKAAKGSRQRSPRKPARRPLR